MQSSLATRKRVLQKPSSGRKGDRLRWKEPAKLSLFRSLPFKYFAVIFALSSTRLRREPPLGGSLIHKRIPHYSFFLFLLIGMAYIEPRHYGGVFVLQ